MRTEHRTAWEVAYLAEGPRLWRSLLLFTGDPEVASDAMSEAFAQGIARGDAVRKPGAWVWKAAFMIARSELGRTSAPEPSLALESANTPIEEVLDVLGALHGLSPMQRAAVVLHHYAGYPLQEVADIVGSSRSAVGVHLFRARRTLRRRLGGDDDD